MEKLEILKLAANSYYVTPDMIKFLLVENLALKSFLHEKGLLSPDDYKKHQENARMILSAKEQDQMLTHLKSLVNSPSQDNLVAEVHKD